MELKLNGEVGKLAHLYCLDINAPFLPDSHVSYIHVSPLEFDGEKVYGYCPLRHLARANLNNVRERRVKTMVIPSLPFNIISHLLLRYLPYISIQSSESLLSDGLRCP